MGQAESCPDGQADRDFFSGEPGDQRLDQAALRRLAPRGRLIIVAGRYEGVDERFIDAEVDEELEELFLMEEVRCKLYLSVCRLQCVVFSAVWLV